MSEIEEYVCVLLVPALEKHFLCGDNKVKLNDDVEVEIDNQTHSGLCVFQGNKNYKFLDKELISLKIR